MNTTEPSTLATQQAAGLRALADLIENNPDLNDDLRWLTSDLSAYVADKEVLAKFARAAVAQGAKVTKDFPPDSRPDRHFYLYASFGPVQVRLHCERAVVCERIVVGTETVTKKVKDPAKLAEVPEIEVTETVETVRWDCKPLLAAEGGVA